jgi:hypothetical protein
MSLDNLSISTDMSYTNGVCTHSAMISKSPNNKREIPCYTCAMQSQCEASSTECVAARVWYYDGNYQDKDVARLIRKVK